MKLTLKFNLNSYNEIDETIRPYIHKWNLKIYQTLSKSMKLYMKSDLDRRNEEKINQNVFS